MRADGRCPACGAVLGAVTVSEETGLHYGTCEAPSCPVRRAWSYLPDGPWDYDAWSLRPPARR